MKAFYRAGSGKGPVLVDISKDITQQLAPYAQKAEGYFPLSETERKRTKLIELIKESKRLYLYRRRRDCLNASEVLKRFVERRCNSVSTSLRE